MNSVEAQIKARAAWKKLHDERPFMLSGPDSPSWNPDREAMKARRAEKLADYKRKNRDKVRVWCANRRKSARGKLSSDLVASLMSSQKYRCAACRASIKDAYHLDHISPIALGGKTEDKNMQLLCPTCNLKKAAKHPVDFMQSMGYLL